MLLVKLTRMALEELINYKFSIGEIYEEERKDEGTLAR